MKKQQLHTNLHFYLTLSLAFFLTLSRLVPLLIVLLLLNWLVAGDFKNKFNVIKKNKLALLFMFFYLLHLFGLTYTQNIASGFFDAEVKFSLFIFPLIFASRPIATKKFNQIFMVFSAGLLLSSIVMLTRALYLYITLHENHFFYEAFSSIIIHPGYMSMYIDLAIGGILLNLFKNKCNELFIHPALAICIILFFSLILLLLSSKMGLLVMVFIYLSFLIYYISTARKYFLGFSILISTLLTIVMIVNYVPLVRERFKTAVSAVTNTEVDNTNAESTAVRLLIWSAANNIIGKNFLIGTGTGDAKDELINEYKTRGLTGALNSRLNAHNEFYQVFVALGIIGFITLLMHLFLPAYYAIKSRHALYLIFLLIIIFNFFTESVLETQAGVVFFAFFNALICFKENQDPSPFIS